MSTITRPHGKLSVASFCQQVFEDHGVLLKVLAPDGSAAPGDSTIASMRSGEPSGADISFEPTMTVAGLERAILEGMGLRVQVKARGQPDPAGQTQLEKLLSKSDASEDRERADRLSITGQKKVSTLQREFSEHHSHLGLMLFSSEEYAKSLQGQPIRPLKGELTIATVREKKSTEDLSIHGKMLVGTLEGRFREVYGLYAQVCIMTDLGKAAYTGEAYDSFTLTELNRRQQEKGRAPYKY